jgi:stage II sporulation protein D
MKRLRRKALFNGYVDSFCRSVATRGKDLFSFVFYGMAYGMAGLTNVCALTGHAALEPKTELDLHRAQTNDERVHIRVRISEAVSVVKIRGFDLRIFQQKNSILSPVAAVDKSSEWELHCQSGQVLLQPFDSNSIHLKQKSYRLSEPVSIQTSAGFIKYGGNPYREEIKIYSSGNHCEVVNVLDLEKYLDGLVNSEFSSQWNEESIEAQVVAARTYAFYQIQEAKTRKNSHFDLDATVKDQVYNGSLRENYHSSQAAARTKGFILTAEGGKKVLPIKAFYHSTCGGLTELPENVWGKSSPGFKKKVLCPYCGGSPRYRWDLELQTKDISSAIIKGVKLEGMLPEWPRQAARVLQQNRLLDVRITQLDHEGRVTRLSTLWADGKAVFELPMTGVRFRDWIGAARFRSTWFQLVSIGRGERSRWHFQGRGNGHGVGLCQWGAKTMGEKGYKMATILKHYYPDAALRKMW